MNDHAFALLARALNQSEGRCLWIVDENTAIEDLSLVENHPHIVAVSNRYDLARTLEQKGLVCQLSDFSADTFFAGSFDAVYYRIGKEKAQLNYCINLAANVLRPEGKLFLAGYKQEGMPSCQKHTSSLWGAVQHRQRLGGASLLQFSRPESLSGLLDDRQYSEIQQIDLDEISFYSKPGIFGWKKRDAGSALLVQHIPTTATERVLDLGCGYGYLSLMAWQKLQPSNPQLWITATDNNVTATMACEKNFAAAAINGEVVLDHCGQSLTEPYSLILCNPPFHQGSDTEHWLSRQFLASSQRLLARKGLALFVVNSFLPLEKLAEKYFSAVQTLANDRQFKVVAMQHALPLSS